MIGREQAVVVPVAGTFAGPVGLGRRHLPPIAQVPVADDLDVLPDAAPGKRGGLARLVGLDLDGDADASGQGNTRWPTERAPVFSCARCWTGRQALYIVDADLVTTSGES